MKRFAIILTLVAIGLPWGCGPAEPPAPEPGNDDGMPIEEIHVEVPSLVQERFDNDWIHVAEFRLEPGETLPLHEGGQRTVYSITDYTVRFKHGERESVVTRAAGTAHWHAGEPHEAENVGDGPVHALIATRTEHPLRGTPEAATSLAIAAGNHARTLLDNGRVNAVEVTLPAGAEIANHPGMNRLLIARGASTLELGDPTTAVVVQPFGQGDLYWQDASSGHVRNVGDDDAVFVAIEFKN